MYRDFTYVDDLVNGIKLLINNISTKFFFTFVSFSQIAENFLNRVTNFKDKNF